MIKEYNMASDNCFVACFLSKVYHVMEYWIEQATKIARNLKDIRASFSLNKRFQNIIMVLMQYPTTPTFGKLVLSKKLEET